MGYGLFNALRLGQARSDNDGDCTHPVCRCNRTVGERWETIIAPVIQWPGHMADGGFPKRAGFAGVAGNEPKKLKKDIALAGLFDRLRARFQTDGGTV